MSSPADRSEAERADAGRVLAGPGDGARAESTRQVRHPLAVREDPQTVDAKRRNGQPPTAHALHLRRDERPTRAVFKCLN